MPSTLHGRRGRNRKGEAAVALWRESLHDAYQEMMRITLDIDDDVLQAAKARARRESKTVGAVVSELVRSALTGGGAAPTARLPKSIHGFRPFPKRGGIVTNELIDKLRQSDVY
jgi:hypothetical protein